MIREVVKKQLPVFISIVISLVLPQVANANELAVNEKLTTLKVESGFIRGPAGVAQEIKYEDKGAFGLFEGDILVDKDGLDADWFATSDGAVIDGFRWPNNTLHYRFDSVSADVRSMVRSAADYITANTNVTLVEITSGTTPYHVRIIDDDFACYANVGYYGASGGTSQLINVVTACGFGATVHEFLHALGMWHEQSREDRNNFVTIFFENIEDGKENNFNQQIVGSSDIGFYDYGSIMHYGRTAFSKNGMPTIESIPPGQTLGQRAGMSSSDIATINDIYPGNLTAPDLVVNNVSVSDSDLTSGDAFTLSLNVANQGDASAASTTLTYYRSDNSVITTVDVNIGNDNIASLASSSSSAQSISLIAPQDAGSYHYGGCVAAVESELSTTNNCSAGQMITVSPAIVVNDDILDLLPAIISASASRLSGAAASTSNAD